jgi:SP family sugar:H+ symporter-like MFS transporter
MCADRANSFFTPFITSAIDFRYGYVFAGCNILAGLLVYFFVIEGKGRTLEEIDTMYLFGVKPWTSSKYVVPSWEDMSAKDRERLEATNPELAIANAEGGGVRASGSAEEEKEKDGVNLGRTRKEEV